MCFYWQEVLQRYPLHTVAQVVCYADSFYKSNIAFKIGEVGKPLFKCYVFQCEQEVSAYCLLLDKYKKRE